MTLIFLSTSDHIYVYLDIFLMGFHLSSTEWRGQEGKQGERERVNQREKESEGVREHYVTRQTTACRQKEEGLRDQRERLL